MTCINEINMAKIIEIHPEKPQFEQLKEAVEVIQQDGVIGYPTETVYGLGANALSTRAVEKVYQLKGREETKPILIIAQNIEQAFFYPIHNGPSCITWHFF